MCVFLRQLFYFIYYFYLFERKGGRERSSIHWFPFHMLATARAGAGQRHESETLSETPMLGTPTWETPT